MTSGEIGDYAWIESVPSRVSALFEAMRELRHHLIGLRAVNVSWDSGLLVPSDEEKGQGWSSIEGRAISPVLDDAVIDNWPWCDGGFEEWYLFSTLPRDVKLSAYCNWIGTSIGAWPALVDTPSGLDLRRQLETARPIVVLGMGDKVFAISRDQALIQDFQRVISKA